MKRSCKWQSPFDLKEFKDSIGIKAVSGEEGYTTCERRSIRPTLDVNGIWGGYTVKEQKQSFPVRPMQKSPCAWFPDQDLEEICNYLEKHFQAIAPEECKGRGNHSPRWTSLCNS